MDTVPPECETEEVIFGRERYDIPANSAVTVTLIAPEGYAGELLIPFLPGQGVEWEAIADDQQVAVPRLPIVSLKFHRTLLLGLRNDTAEDIEANLNPFYYAEQFLDHLAPKGGGGPNILCDGPSGFIEYDTATDTLRLPPELEKASVWREGSVIHIGEI